MRKTIDIFNPGTLIAYDVDKTFTPTWTDKIVIRNKRVIRSIDQLHRIVPSGVCIVCNVFVSDSSPIVFVVSSEGFIGWMWNDDLLNVGDLK